MRAFLCRFLWISILVSTYIGGSDSSQAQTVISNNEISVINEIFGSTLVAKTKLNVSVINQTDNAVIKNMIISSEVISRDGKEVAIVASKAGNDKEKLYIEDIKDGHLRCIDNKENKYVYVSPVVVWSADSKDIVIEATLEDEKAEFGLGESGIWKVSSDGKEKEKLYGRDFALCGSFNGGNGIIIRDIIQNKVFKYDIKSHKEEIYEYPYFLQQSPDLKYGFEYGNDCYIYRYGDKIKTHVFTADQVGISGRIASTSGQHMWLFDSSGILINISYSNKGVNKVGNEIWLLKVDGEVLRIISDYNIIASSDSGKYLIISNGKITYLLRYELIDL